MKRSREEEQEDATFSIVQIIGHRVDRDEYRFKVNWSDGSTSWEPQHRFLGPKEGEKADNPRPLLILTEYLEKVKPTTKSRILAALYPDALPDTIDTRVSLSGSQPTRLFPNLKPQIITHPIAPSPPTQNFTYPPFGPTLGPPFQILRCVPVMNNVAGTNLQSFIFEIIRQDSVTVFATLAAVMVLHLDYTSRLIYLTPSYSYYAQLEHPACVFQQYQQLSEMFPDFNIAASTPK